MFPILICSLSQVYDGPTNRSTILGKFCGTEPPPNLVSTSGAVYVYYFAHWPLQGDGFQATFNAPMKGITGNVINGYPKTGFI